MKNIALVCLLIVTFVLHSKMWINPSSEIIFGPNDFSIYGGIKVDLTKQNDSAKNKAAGIYFEPTSRLLFESSVQDTLTNLYTLNNVTVNKKGGSLWIEQNLDILGHLEFVSGNIMTGSDTLSLAAPTSTLTGESETGFVSGTLSSKRYIGSNSSAATDHFGGIGFKINNSGNDLGTVTVHRKTGEGSQVVILESEGIKRQWEIQTSVPFSGTRNVSAEWLEVEDNGNRRDHLRVWKYDGTWDSLTTADFVTNLDPRTATFDIDAAAKYTVNNTDTYFAGGSGTWEDPYLIRTPQHLDSLRYYLGDEWNGCSFKQIANIDLGVSPWNTGSGWSPIGVDTLAFMADYNGNGFSINNLTINRTSEEYVGLFGNVSDSFLRKIVLNNANVQGNNYTGILAGSLYQYNYLDSCVTVGSVAGNYSVGGLVGRIMGYSSMSTCSSNGTVQGELYTGGLAGYSDNSYFNYSYSKSNITGVSDAGGLIGYGYASYVSDSYAYGSVSGTNNAGGFIGNANQSNLFNVYSKGLVTCLGTAGGLIGYSTITTASNCYWDTQASGQMFSAGGEGRTTDEMTFEQAANTYIGWDFTTWQINYGINGGYPYLSWQNIPNTNFAGGSGTTENPYLIATATQLNNVRYYSTKAFRQTADIDLGVSPWNQNEGWDPISTDWMKPFRGSYDGDYHSISNLTIERDSMIYNYVGLFGIARSAEIKEIKISSADVSGYFSAGILIGSCDSTSVQNCSVSGAISGAGNVGGLGGYISNSNVTQCFSEADVTAGWSNAGGLIGYNSTTSISNCFASGSVEGDSFIGGLVGSDNSSQILYCYSTGAVSGTGGNIGGFIGSSSGYIYSCYWNTQTSGQPMSAGGEGRTTDDMTFDHNEMTTYLGWDFLFTPVWDINYGVYSGYPYLHWQNLPNNNFAGGSGTSADPYLVSNATQLNMVRYYRTKAFRQTADIDLGVSPWNEGDGWIPIGNDWMYPFRGTYEGDYHTISNLTVSRDSLMFSGLFGITNSAQFKEINITDANVAGFYSVGILAGSCDSTSIQNCSVYGEISGEGSVGGLAGYINVSSVAQCFSTAAVNCPEGYNSGGLVGYSNTNSNVENCYSTGAVIGEGNAGGLIGNTYLSNVFNSYSTGAVTGSSSGIGGLIGINYSGNITMSYWNTQTSGQTISAGGEGKTTDEMTYPFDSNTYMNWDFSYTPIWKYHTSLNGGYPYLAWESRTSVEAPTNLAITYSAGNVTLNWTGVTGADSYKVYSSATPYGTFILDTSGILSGTQWTAPSTGAKKFYYVTAVNQTKIRIISIKEGNTGN